MKLIKQLVLMFLFIFFNYTFSEEIEERKLEVGYLSNGMKYYHVNKSALPNRISINLVINAGSLQEEEEERGAAHFLEHMVFNGTEKYKGNEVIKGLEALGLKLGHDINAGTSFNKTVYNLNFPANNKKEFEEGMDILKEMMFSISLDEAEIEKEREIIKEEWRLNQGFKRKIDNIVDEISFGTSSRYLNRKPLGRIEDIKRINKNNLLSFYNKWYVPKNMAVVIIGDIEKTYLLEVLNKYFNIKKEASLEKRENYPLNGVETSYYLFRDKEIKKPEFYAIANTIKKEDESLKNQSRIFFFRNIVNNRLKKLISSQSEGIISGEFKIHDYMQLRYISLSAHLREDKIREGIREITTPIRYTKEYGVSEEELDLEMKSILSQLEKTYSNKRATSDEEIATKIIDSYIYNEPLYRRRNELEITRKLQKQIKPIDIQNVANEMFYDKMAYLLILPEDNKSFKNEEEFKNFILEVRKEKLTKEEKTNYNELRLKEPNLISGKIEKIEEKKDYKEISLSNGMKFLYKELDYKKDEIYISLFKEEGSSVNTKSGYLNSDFAPGFVLLSGVENIKPKDLNIYKKGKNFQISSYISDYEQEISIVSDKKSLDEGLKYFSYLVRNPKLDEKLYEKNILNMKSILKNKEKSVISAYQEEVIKSLYNNHERKRELSLEDVEKLSREEMLRVFKEKFGNFSNYKGMIVGNIKEDEVIKILSKYFASLDTNSLNDKKWKDLEIIYPKGIIRKKLEIESKADNKTVVNIYYPLYKNYNIENNYLGNASIDILRIVLLNRIREKISGVYSVVVEIEMNPYEQGLVNIGFATHLKKKAEILEEIKKEIEDFTLGKINEEALESVRRNYEISYKNNIKIDSYWKKYLKNMALEESYKVLTPKEYNELITKENLKEYLKDFISQDNYLEISLVPKDEFKN